MCHFTWWFSICNESRFRNKFRTNSKLRVFYFCTPSCFWNSIPILWLCRDMKCDKKEANQNKHDMNFLWIISVNWAESHFQITTSQNEIYVISTYLLQSCFPEISLRISSKSFSTLWSFNSVLVESTSFWYMQQITNFEEKGKMF